MKLKELLVQELPKCGGWPDGIEAIEQSVDGFIFDSLRPGNKPLFYGRKFKVTDNWRSAIVTSKQYEAALAASQKVEWDGAGLPPVGIEVESAQPGKINWTEFKVIAVDSGAVFGFWSNGVASALDADRWLLRPIRSEADKKRKETIDLMDKRFNEILAAGSTEAMAIFATVYDTIAAGKIPGVRIE